MGNDNKVKTPFQTLFAVHMTCDSCVKSVSDALYSLGGINKVEADLKEQLVTVEGTAAPSAIVSAIEDTGRDAILRGSGNTNSAAVAILETYHHTHGEEEDGKKSGPAPDDDDINDGGGDGSTFTEREVRGLARMVQVSPSTTLVDLTVRGVSPGEYAASIREYGDLKHGAASTGPVWGGWGSGSSSSAAGSSSPRGSLGTLTVGPDGRGAVFLDHGFQVWEVIGHALVVTPLSSSSSSSSQEEEEKELRNDANTVVGVVARSAGMWDNDKTVCSCTGKTLWEERKDEVQKGMI